jgi:two-component system LytT family response regulator
MKHLTTEIKFSNISWPLALSATLIFLVGLTVFQDFLSANLQQTGFYWTESLLYNTFWLYFPLLLYGINRFYRRPPPQKAGSLIFYSLATGLIGGLLHLILCTTGFVLASHFFFDPPHRFSHMFATALSNQLYLTFSVYALYVPVRQYWLSKKEKRNNPTYPDHITVRSGTQQVILPATAIQAITSDRPYTAIRTLDKKYFHKESLSKLEQQLDPAIFLRVHRSAIVNKQAVVTLTSRQNGDYDAVLANDQTIRLSRHYRQQWEALLH